MKLGLLGDIHDDIDSLKLALKAIQEERCDQIICLGDIVGSSVPNVINYLETRSSHASIELIKSSCDIALVGNHDLNAVQKVPKHTGIYKFPKNWYRMDYFSRYNELKDKVWHYENELSSLIDRNDRIFLIGLPEIVLKYYENDLGIMYTHYAYPDVTGTSTVVHNQPRFLEKHFKHMNINKTSISFSGHGHANGTKVFSPTQVNDVPFGTKISLDPSDQYWIVAPAVVNDGKNKTGVLTFNTLTYELEAIKL